MPEGRGKKTGRGARGRGVATRQSRHVQGLETEEQKDLDTVNNLTVSRSRSCDQRGGLGGCESWSGSKSRQGGACPEGDAQASVGGADLAWSPEVVDLVSESASSAETESLNGSVNEMKRNPASVMTEVGNQDADTDPDVAPSAPEDQSSSQGANPEVSSEGDGEGDAEPATAMDLVPGRGLTDEEYAVVYVYREVRRWKDEHPGCVRPPVVECA
ncbi:hypothetical protein PI124_g2526 [Phytophthora idaei]|nr:hypothetical protein PI124_g2526 [Phytophthora idaei]